MHVTLSVIRSSPPIYEGEKMKVTRLVRPSKIDFVNSVTRAHQQKTCAFSFLFGKKRILFFFPVRVEKKMLLKVKFHRKTLTKLCLFIRLSISMIVRICIVHSHDTNKIIHSCCGETNCSRQRRHDASSSFINN